MKTIEDYIVVEFDRDEPSDRIRITKRDNFETVKLCETYKKYGQKVGCYDAGCYTLENSSCDALKDLKAAIEEKFDFDPSIVECEGEFIVEPGDDIPGDDENEMEALRNSIDEFIAEWRENNETHTEVTAWTYHDSHNFCTVVLKCDFGEPSCEELLDSEQEWILEEMPETPHIEGTNESVETENYIFYFDRWATNPWICTVEKK